MKIGLNATCISNRPSGARQRFVGIYSKLAARLPETEFVIYEPRDCAVASWFDKLPNVSGRRTPIPSNGRAAKYIHGLSYWTSALASEAFAFFEMFSLPVVKTHSGRSILTIHDIRGARPDTHVINRSIYNKFLNRSLRSVDHVITVSETMKKEILRVVPDIGISVVYNGVDCDSFIQLPHDALLITRQKYELPQEFILAVGHLEERKNYVRLLEAMVLLRDNGISCPLVIVGKDSGMGRPIKNLIASLKLTGQVTILSDLTDLEVRCAYRLCSLFVFPSAYEGFGIPILEAMAAERPMVLSDIPVFREITQGSSVYFPPDDIEVMALAIESVLTSDSEHERMVAYGKQRVKTFSFENLSAQSASLYRSLG